MRSGIRLPRLSALGESGSCIGRCPLTLDFSYETVSCVMAVSVDIFIGKCNVLTCMEVGTV